MSEEIAVNDIKGPYYMTFRDKADYGGPKDKDGVILFDYYFDIGSVASEEEFETGEEAIKYKMPRIEDKIINHDVFVL